MRLGIALFLVYFLIFALCFSWPIARIAGDLRTRYLESLEEPLVDQANILAAVVGHGRRDGRFTTQDLREALDDAFARRLSARIYEMSKDRVDVHVYMTDAAGVAVFDSENPSGVGTDYAGWRDVNLTLRGEYGARTTRKIADDPASAVLYVGAPIRADGETVGVLSVAKPTASINAFLEKAKPEVFRIGALSALVALSLSLLVSVWVSGQIGRLTRYANDVRDGRRVDLPRLAPTELREMGLAFDKMRESLEGKRYVEEYVQTLTHELKSPVSAIRGAAELLEEEMAPQDRARFVANIRTEAERIQDLVERMLRLSVLETRKALGTVEPIAFGALLREALKSKEPMISRKRLDVQARIADGLVVRGDRFLLSQAISNLVQNAIDFSPEGGRVALAAEARGGRVLLAVEDQGPGIPDYAKDKVFNKFFSLARPDTGKKSTGLGLNFSREVASLHDGDVRLENLPEAGVRATLTLPASA